jgi:hypothetical protein
MACVFLGSPFPSTCSATRAQLHRPSIIYYRIFLQSDQIVVKPGCSDRIISSDDWLAGGLRGRQDQIIVCLMMGIESLGKLSMSLWLSGKHDLANNNNNKKSGDNVSSNRNRIINSRCSQVYRRCRVVPCDGNYCHEWLSRSSIRRNKALINCVHLSLNLSLILTNQNVRLNLICS